MAFRDKAKDGTTRVTGAIPLTFDDIYPVGSIYMSVNNVDPGALFGGTWSVWGTGSVPVGVNPADPAFDTVEKVGGEKNHTLTASEQADMWVGSKTSGGAAPTSASSIPNIANGITGVGESVTDAAASTNRFNLAGAGFPGTVWASLYAAGGNGSHNNLQPYITCYMWKRTA